MKNAIFLRIAIPVIALIIQLFTGCRNQVDRVSFVSLLGEMTNRESIAQFPNYILKQASSYDRSQKGPEDPDSWFNNKDYGYYIRKEVVEGRTEYVIMEVNGPGCITRWWIPLENTYRQRIVRIYLDGNSQPAIEENYHDFISGKSFVKEPFAFISSDEKETPYQSGLPVGHPKQMGADLYLPIPFSESCKITLDDNPFYYVINYRSYQPQVRVESFTKAAFESAEGFLDKTAIKLTQESNPDFNLSKKQTIPTNEAMTLDLPPGENAIRSIQLKIDPGLSKESLRAAVIKIVFDDNETVWCPITEFFGGGVYVRSVRNWNASVSTAGLLLCKWFMPYHESARIELLNYHLEPLEAELAVHTTSDPWDDQTLYFHANWHEEAPIRIDSPVDWNYIEIEGKGIYVGDVLTVHSFSKSWWGEGDEKIYVDGEPFPSQLGTGLEDYYGFAWGMAHHFSSPFISIPLRDARGKGDWRGYTTISRMRLLDGIPFQNSLKLDVEAWLHDSTVSYAACTFWYGSKDAACNRIKEEDAVRRKLPDFIEEKPAEIPGKIYDDPALLTIIEPKGNASVVHAGNHLDLVEWHNPAIPKPLDADKDNSYGTAGYYFPAGKRLDTRSIQISPDSIDKPPVFIAYLQITGTYFWDIQNAWLVYPSKRNHFLISGSSFLSCSPDVPKGVIELYMNDRVPDIFRLGIMTDNMGEYADSGLYLSVISSRNGDSERIPMARSNRVPDWYFFDMKGLREGDKIMISGSCGDEGVAVLPVGAVVFN